MARVSEAKPGREMLRPEVPESRPPEALVHVPGGQVRFDDDGLVPAVVQDATSKAVLMLAWMDAAALRLTTETGRATYWSRRRRALWVKGATSGNVQHVREVRLDCDADTVLLLVDQHGPACHTGATTCFDDATLFTDDSGGRPNG